MIAFAVTVFIRLYTAGYKVIFNNFVQLVIEGGLQWRAAYIFFCLFYQKAQMTLIFSWVRFFD